jgi:SpoVK/Ycf46/Vps4 family AAA+-type ATPase
MDNQVRLILGMRGKGKTTLAQQLTLDSRRLFIVDPRSEYRGDLIFESVGALRRYFRTSRPEFRCVLRLNDEAEDEEGFEIIWAVGRCVLLVDEVDLFLPNMGGSRMFKKLVKYGRHRSIELLAVTRRPAEISRLLSSQSDEIISFRQEEERDLAWCAKRHFDVVQLSRLELYQYVTNKQH